MELHQLRSFIAIAEEKNLTRASERLFLSQSAVSAHLKSLEDALGVTLFTRTAKGMQLTPEGMTLLERARSLLDSANAMLQEAKSLSGELRGTLKIGFNTDPNFLRVADLSTRMRQAYPDIELRLVQAMTTEVLDSVQRGEMDGGFTFGNTANPALAVLDLASVPLHIVGPAKWKSVLDSADMRALAGMPWVWVPPSCPFHNLLDGRFAEQGLTLKRVVETDHEDILRALVIAGEGVSILRKAEAEELERLGRVAIWRGMEIAISLGFVHKASRDEDPLIRATVQTVLGIWRAAAYDGEDS
jgi:DNA-binding transcriptional LysR family regulator